MKNKFQAKTVIRHSLLTACGTALLAAMALLTITPSALAQQGTNYTLSAGDFQRMVYGAHLHTQLTLKPELGASLQVLLEMQRRNPFADPLALAALSSNALQRYRTYEPSYIRTNGYPDEILAAYLDALRYVPAPTNYIPVNLTMLTNFTLGQADYDFYCSNYTVLQLINSSDQRLSSTEGQVSNRQVLVSNCVARAQGNAAFATAMDSLLAPETGVWLAETPGDIIGDTNSPLFLSPTMQTLLALSQASGNGSLTVSSNTLINLFTNEMGAIWQTINTNLAVLAQINQSQPDYLAYLNNQSALDGNVTFQAAVQLNQPAQIASSTAAVLVQSQLMSADSAAAGRAAQMESAVSAGCDLAVGIAEACDGEPKGIESLMSGSLDIFNLFSGVQSPQDVMAAQLSNIQTLVEELYTNMNYQFGRVTESLTTIYDSLNANFNLIEIQGQTEEQQLALLETNLYTIRNALVTAQSSLDRTEAETFADLQTLEMGGSVGTVEYQIDNDLLYTVQYPPTRPPLTESEYISDEGLFYVYACENAIDGINSPTNAFASPVAQFLSPLDENLNYIQWLLSTPPLSQRTGGSTGATNLANPQSWFIGAYAYLQLASENPMFFRKDASAGQLLQIINTGQNVANFCSSLSFTGTNVNWSLFNALETNYLSNLCAFNTQVSNTESTYANFTNFALGAWRQWDIAAPRVTAASSAVRLATPNKVIAAGGYHSLKVTPYGTVVGWGYNTDGQITIPAGLTNVVAVGAGTYHSVALKANGTVVAWGDNTYGQTNVPKSATNVVAISAGYYHTLALRSDGCVVAWGAGTNNSGADWNNAQCMVPSCATSNIVAIAAGGYHSLALNADGTPVGWGLNTSGQTNIPPNVTNIIAIGAGHDHNSALFADGSVFCWGASTYGETNVPPQATNIVALASWAWQNLALRADGALIGWGRDDLGQATGVPNTNGNYYSGGPVMVGGQAVSNVTAIAPGFLFGMAQRFDGTIVGWGDNSYQQSIPRGWVAGPSVRNHIAAGGGFSLAVKADGTVVGWGEYTNSENLVNGGLSSVVAVAASYAYSDGMALRSDHNVIMWETNGILYGIPTSVINGAPVVAISAGNGFYNSFNLALKADGTVVGWGDNTAGQTDTSGWINVVAIAAGNDFTLALDSAGTVVGCGQNIDGQISPPGSATNVVAIAAGGWFSLALRADGTVVGWGQNTSGQATGVPSSGDNSGQVIINGQSLSNVVAIAAGYEHGLALKADGTVVGWGDNTYGETNTTGLTNVVAIAAGAYNSLALEADGTVVGKGWDYNGDTAAPANVVDLDAWGEYPPGAFNVPPVSSPITAVGAGSAHSLALTASGSVVAWGLNTWGQTNVPPQALSGIQAVASGFGHSLALTSNGCVVAWGLNDFGQTNVPSAASNGAVAISAGAKHNLALTANGYVVAWGLNDYGQTNVPPTVPNQLVQFQGQVVAIAAGAEHSLALTAGGTVVAWGDNDDGQTNVPAQAQSGVVAIAAGRYHSLALMSGGGVVAWGLNNLGQTNVPAAAQSGVVAIAAGLEQSLALKADGTIVVWGSGPAAFLPPPAWSNVVAIAAGDRHSLLLTASSSSDTNSVQTLSFFPAPIPARVTTLLIGDCGYLNSELVGTGSLYGAATALSGAKALLTNVLALAIPYTLDQDGILHGFLYGSQSLMDSGAAGTFFQAQMTNLQTNGVPAVISGEDALCYQCFVNRLNQCLTNLQASGQTEIPRLLGHTLRLLNVLSDAYTAPANSPPPTLELSSQSNSPSLLLYGEPFMYYTLEYCGSLGPSGWTTTTVTNLTDEESITPPYSGSSQRFYRAALPVP